MMMASVEASGGSEHQACQRIGQAQGGDHHLHAHSLGSNDAFHDDALEEAGQDGHRYERDGNHGQVGPAHYQGKKKGDVAADHEDFALGEIGHVGGFENNHYGDCQQRVHAARHQSRQHPLLPEQPDIGKAHDVLRQPARGCASARTRPVAGRWFTSGTARRS